MKTSDRMKLYLYQHKENKRYKKFKSCTLPYPFFDEKRLTFEWVTYIKKQYCKNNNINYKIISYKDNIKNKIIKIINE